MNDDRRVHAETGYMEVVRYDRAGKWYLEPKTPGLKRRRVSIQGAVDYAAWAWRQAGGEIHFGLNGGAMFDRKVKRILGGQR